MACVPILPPHPALTLCETLGKLFNCVEFSSLKKASGWLLNNVGGEGHQRIPPTLHNRKSMYNFPLSKSLTINSLQLTIKSYWWHQLFFNMRSVCYMYYIPHSYNKVSQRKGNVIKKIRRRRKYIYSPVSIFTEKNLHKVDPRTTSLCGSRVNYINSTKFLRVLWEFNAL